MTLKKTNAATAKALRLLAKDYEEKGVEDFTCNKIVCLGLGDKGWRVRRAYASVFEFDGSTNNDNERKLWNQHADETLNDRIMLLCMAAAMAETGDL